MSKTMIICSFTSGLDDLTRKQQRDPVAVLRVLKETGRFSVFEATANDTIASMMGRLMTKGYSTITDGVRKDYGKLVEHDGGAYPWTKVRLTEAGLRLLVEADASRSPAG